MRLELNLPALERLIGGDTEIEVELRHQIVENFCDRHIKKILNNETFRRVNQIWEEKLKDEVHHALNELQSMYDDKLENDVEARHLRWDFRKMVEKGVSIALEGAVQETITREQDRLSRRIMQTLHNELEKMVEKALNEKVARGIENLIDARLGEEIERRIQEGIQRRLDAARKL